MRGMMLTGSRVADLGQPLRPPQEPVDVPAGHYAPAFAPREPYRGLRWTDVPQVRPPPPPAPVLGPGDLEFYPPPHFGAAPGGYIPSTSPMTREQVIEEEEKEIIEQLRQLERQIWEKTVRGPTARVSVPLPAGGGMAIPFTGT